MNELKMEDVEILLIALLRNDSFAKRAADWLEHDHIDRNHVSPVPGMLWMCAKHFATVDEMKRIPTITELRIIAPSVIRDHVTHFGGDYDDFVAQANAIITAISSLDTDMVDVATPVLRMAYSTYIENVEMEKAVYAAQASGDWAAVRDAALKLGNDKAMIEVGKVEADPFAMMDRVDTDLGSDAPPVESSRMLTGVNIIDTLHRGKGMYRGFMTLILGPTSGGKTILAHQLMASMASLGRQIVFVSTEEDLDTAEETKSRLYAACSDRTTDEWSAAGNDPRRFAEKLTAEQITRIKAVRSNTTFVSFDSSPAWSEIAARTAAIAEKKKQQPDMVIVDWAGPLATAMMAAERIRDQHEALERLCMYAMDFAKRTGICTVILHQLAAAACEKKGVFGKYTEFDSQLCKRMTQYSAATYIITPADKQGRVRFLGPKLRFDVKNTEVVAQLNPRHSRIDYCESMTVSGNTFSSKDGKVLNKEGKKMPSVKKDET